MYVKYVNIYIYTTYVSDGIWETIGFFLLKI